MMMMMNDDVKNLGLMFACPLFCDFRELDKNA